MNNVILLSLLLFLCVHCDEVQTCNNKGIYDIKTHQCICIDEYETIGDLQCIYQKRSKMIAVLMSFFGGFLGAEQFYLGNTFKGFAKIFVPIILLISIMYCKMNFMKDLPNYYLLLPLGIAILFWIIDIVLIVSGVTKDGKGFELI